MVEAPLEIRVHDEALVVTMRTPGHDEELAAGFLFTEGRIESRTDIESLTCGEDRVDVSLTPKGRERFQQRQTEARLFPASSACGVCGKPSLEDLWQRIPRLEELPLGPEELTRRVLGLPERMKEHQSIFAATGGAHAAGLFDLEGELLALREDIGRHNAVDKIIGAALLEGRIPLHRTILVSSGRAGFEIVQKALVAAVPVVAAVGAASSLAATLAESGGQMLFSFVGLGRANRHLPATDGEPRWGRIET